MIKEIAIIGVGGLGREISAIIKAINKVRLTWEIIGFFDDSEHIGDVNGLPYLGNLSDLKSYKKTLSIVIGVGNPGVKKKIFSEINIGFVFPNIIHPSASVDFGTLKMGQGNVIAINTVLTVNIKLSNFTYINTGSILAHDVIVGDFTMIMPSVTISAGAKIGKEVYIGNGVKIDQPINIEDCSYIPIGQLLSFQKKRNNQILLSASNVSLANTYSYYFEAIQNNEVTSRGSNINGFEGDLENYLGNNTKVAVLSSGTAALHLAMVMSGIMKDDVVLCQSMTYAASANPICYQGAIPVFIDSEPHTWNMCPEKLEITIKDLIAKNQKPKAVVIVHLYGMPAKIDEILAIVKKYEIILIEDAAEALGSSYKGQMCGTFGDYGVLSFNGNKIITTSGGGALVCKNEEEKTRAIFLATQSRDNAVHYQHSEIGYNYRMSNVLAGIGRGQMQVLDKNIKQRRDNNEFYKSLFKNVIGIEVFNEPSDLYMSNHWLSCVLIDENITGFSREELRLHLLKFNIESRPSWKPMHLQPVFEKFRFYGDGISEKIFKKGLCLPSGSNLLDEDRERIKKAILLMF